MELNDKAMAEFEHKLKHSVVDKRLLPYIRSLEKTNYYAFDALVMLLIEKGDWAFVQGVRIAVALDPNTPQYKVVEY